MMPPLPVHDAPSTPISPLHLPSHSLRDATHHLNGATCSAHILCYFLTMHTKLRSTCHRPAPGFSTAVSGTVGRHDALHDVSAVSRRSEDSPSAAHEGAPQTRPTHQDGQWPRSTMSHATRRNMSSFSCSLIRKSTSSCP